MNPRGPLLVLTRPLEDTDSDVSPAPAVLRLPLIELIQREHEPQLDNLLASAQQAGLLVFVSRFAARSAFALAPQLRHNRTARWYAVGPASARTVGELFGVEVTAPATESANSEGLLDLFASVSGQRCALFVAPEGRTLLADRLRERGARVDLIEVYQRRRTVVDTTALDMLGAQHARLAFSATSVAVLEALVALLMQLGWRAADTRIVVSAPRIAEAARNHGFEQIQLARSADPADLLAGLSRLVPG